MEVVCRAVSAADGAAAAVGRFCREADVLGRLAHPNLAGHRASGAAGDVLSVVMESVPGPTAAAVVAQSGPLPSARVRDWAGQLLAGLAHAHDAGFVHRDVKPANPSRSNSMPRLVRTKMASTDLARKPPECLGYIVLCEMVVWPYPLGMKPPLFVRE